MEAHGEPLKGKARLEIGKVAPYACYRPIFGRRSSIRSFARLTLHHVGFHAPEPHPAPQNHAQWAAAWETAPFVAQSTQSDPLSAGIVILPDMYYLSTKLSPLTSSRNGPSATGKSGLSSTSVIGWLPGATARVC